MRTLWPESDEEALRPTISSLKPQKDSEDLSDLNSFLEQKMEL